MLIYLAIHKESKKLYVGQTTRELWIRIRGHLTEVNNNYFDNAVRKHGKDAFYWLILERCSSLDELNEREVHWISILNTIKPFGYNLDSGGKNKKHHLETIQNISEHRTGKGLFSDERKHLWSEMNSGEKNKFYGKKHTEETKKKLRDFHTGRHMPQEAIEKIRSFMKARKLTEEHRKNISLSMIKSHALRKLKNT